MSATPQCSNLPAIECPFQIYIEPRSVHSEPRSKASAALESVGLHPALSLQRPSDRPDGIGAADQERREAKHKHGVAETRPKVLPERRAGARVVRGKEQRHHENQPTSAG